MDPGHRAGLWWCQDLNPSAAWLNYFLCCLEPGTPALPCGLCTVARALAEWDIHARQAPTHQQNALCLHWSFLSPTSSALRRPSNKELSQLPPEAMTCLPSGGSLPILFCPSCFSPFYPIPATKAAWQKGPGDK